MTPRVLGAKLAWNLWTTAKKVADEREARWLREWESLTAEERTALMRSIGEQV